MKFNNKIIFTIFFLCAMPLFAMEHDNSDWMKVVETLQDLDSLPNTPPLNPFDFRATAEASQSNTVDVPHVNSKTITRKRKSPNTLKNHKEKAHPEKKILEFKYACREGCDQTFSSFYNRRSHEKELHGTQSLEAQNNNQEIEKDQVTEAESTESESEKEKPSEKQELEQVKNNQSQNKFQCSGCGKLHKDTYHKNKHEQVCLRTIFTCRDKECKKNNITFSSKELLRDHKEQAHIVALGKKPHRCTGEGCYQVFDRESSLQQHTISHSGANPFVCQLCGTELTSKSNLTRHTKICLKNHILTNMQQ